jgi:hypothetical protein
MHSSLGEDRSEQFCVLINGDFYHAVRCEDFVNIYFCGRQLEGNIHNYYLHFDANNELKKFICNRSVARHVGK